MPNYFYNNLKTIVQTPTHIMIQVEMVHDARVIRMNQPHLPSNIRKWMGDSVGRWEGDTLRRRHDQLHGQDAVPRIHRQPARRRAVLARRTTRR